MKGLQTRHHTVTVLMDQLKSINDKGKKQICKMRLTLESMVDVHKQMCTARDIDESLAMKKSSHCLLAISPELSTKMSDNQAREVEKMVKMEKGENGQREEEMEKAI